MSDATPSSAHEDLASAREDLAFLRGLVDEDWRPGLWTFGAIYVSIGAVLVLHVAISWSASVGLLPLKGWSMLAAYGVLYGAFSILWSMIGQRGRRIFQKSGASLGGVKGRAGGAALAGAFAGHLTMLVVFLIVAARQRDAIFLELAPLVLFTLQGAAWFVVHAMRRVRWHLFEAWGWLLATVALAPLVGTDLFGPGVGIAAVVLMIIPGVHMMRVARRA
jgi:hypothetical protein